MRTSIKLWPSYVEYLGPEDFAKVTFIKFPPANLESIGDIHRVSNLVFQTSPVIIIV